MYRIDIDLILHTKPLVWKNGGDEGKQIGAAEELGDEEDGVGLGIGALDNHCSSFSLSLSLKKLTCFSLWFFSLSGVFHL